MKNKLQLLFCLLLLLTLFSSTVKVSAQTSAGNKSILTNPYRRTAGFGFTNPYHSSVNYPTFGIPVSTGDGFFNVPSGTSQLPMWKAPSGYLYPWAARPKSFNFRFPMPVLVSSQASKPAAPAVPPLTVVISDMERFLQKLKAENKLSSSDAGQIEAKVQNLKSREHRNRITGKGNFNPADEAQMRRILDGIGKEISAKLSS